MLGGSGEQAKNGVTSALVRAIIMYGPGERRAPGGIAAQGVPDTPGHATGGSVC